MIRSYEHGCGRYKPTLRLSCALISFCITVSEFLLAVYEYLESREGNMLAGILTGIFLFHAVISFLYFCGTVREQVGLLLPFLTFQLIGVTTLGLLVIIWWIATILAAFDLVQYRSPIDVLTTAEFFVVTGVILLFVFIITVKVSMILYKGYKRVEKEHLCRLRFGVRVERSLSRCTTIPPTNL
ncbi:unnamed protein product [Auanema sp. JU1783]|nr:unnamed protein product [Auanema sp. JU1783]